jgi:antitoxin component YwqK of YwqJK toxin-antitoxin module
MIVNMKYLMILVVGLLMSGCGGSLTGKKYDLTGFNKEDLGGQAVLAQYTGADNSLLAKGTLIQNVRNGAWMTYHTGTNKIETLTNYVNGRKNGIELVLNDRGQIEQSTEYKNDQLHGLSAKYRFGRPTEETNYKNGKMDGPFSIYNDRGNLQRRGNFKNGKQHGILQYFDEEGNVTLEYEYENGEKVGGGIVEPSNTTEE